MSFNIHSHDFKGTCLTAQLAHTLYQRAAAPFKV